MACGSFADFNIRTFLNNVGASKLPLKILGEHNRPRQDVRSHPGSARSVRISIKGLNSGDSFTHIAVASSIVSAVALIFFIISVHEVTPACKSIQEDFSFPSRVGHDSIRVGPLSQLILKQVVSANSLNQNLLLNWKNLLMFGSTVES